MIKYLYLSVCLVILTGCKSTSLFQEEQNTTQKIVPGNIGLNKDFLLENSYNNTAVPEYNVPVKISTTLLPFTKKRFHAFSMANDAQSAKMNITYVDSLDHAPKYVQLKIIDKVAILNALNEKANKSVKSYLATDYKASVVTQISIAFDQSILNLIQNADKAFLVQNGMKSNGIQLYKNDEPIRTIDFSEGVIFSYKTQNCCWSANNKFKVDVVDLVDDKTDCPAKTYTTAKKAEKKINLYKL